MTAETPMLWFTPDDEDRAEYAAFLAGLPDNTRPVAERFDPWTMYRLRQTGQRCRVLAFGEPEGDHGVTIRIYAEHESLGPMSAVEVFGIDPDDLLPWDGESRPDWVVERNGASVTFSIKDPSHAR